MKFESDEQRAFDKYINIPMKYIFGYVERGDCFVRFKDPETGKLFEVRLKEIKPKKKS